MKKILSLWGIFVIICFLVWSQYFLSTADMKKDSSQIKGEQKYAYFAGGCFWCMEGIFEAQDGVYAAESGYIGGSADSANYTQVASWETQHREAVRVSYDPESISYATLVELFWTQIDPTDPDGQFADKGYQYTTAIYVSDDEERQIAEASKIALAESGKFEQEIVTEILKTPEFYLAESYHQDYYKKSALRYNLYKKWSGRAGFIEENWRQEIAKLTQDTYSDEALRKRLTPLQYHVTQEEGTERAFQNEYWDNKRAGIYVDIIDGTPLYSSLDKFDSWTWWPSFTRALSDDVVTTHTDTRFFMTRTEVRSRSSDAHLGHIFSDAPDELWGIRHCINSAALRFVPVEDLEQEGYEEYKKMFE